MKSDWFKHLGSKPSDVEKSKLSSMLYAHEETLYLLYDILSKKVVHTLPADYYTEPNFAYRLADRNGYNRAIEEVLALIDINSTKE